MKWFQKMKEKKKSKKEKLMLSQLWHGKSWLRAFLPLCITFFRDLKFGNIPLESLEINPCDSIQLTFYFVYFKWKCKHWRSSKLADYYSNPFSRSVIKWNHIPFRIFNTEFVIELPPLFRFTESKIRSVEVYTDLLVFDFR